MHLSVMKQHYKLLLFKSAKKALFLLSISFIIINISCRIFSSQGKPQDKMAYTFSKEGNEICRFYCTAIHNSWVKVPYEVSDSFESYKAMRVDSMVFKADNERNDTFINTCKMVLENSSFAKLGITIGYSDRGSRRTECNYNGNKSYGILFGVLNIDKKGVMESISFITMSMGYNLSRL